MSSNDWMVKWQYIIDKISRLISAEGKKIVLFNVEAQRDSAKQFQRYEEMCETVKNTFEAIVTSLPREERIFWPFKDAQFYIIEGVEKVKKY